MVFGYISTSDWLNIDIPGYYPGRISYTDVTIGGSTLPSDPRDILTPTLPAQIDIPTTIPEIPKQTVPGSSDTPQTVPSGGNNTPQTVPSGGSDTPQTVPGGSDTPQTVQSVNDTQPAGQVITNNIDGNPLEQNEKVVSTVDKINYTKKIAYESLKEKFLKACNDDPVLKDILENGADSEYLQKFDEDTRKYLSDLLVQLHDFAENPQKVGSKIVDIESFFVDTLKKLDGLANLLLPTTDRPAYSKAMKTYNNIRDMFSEDLSVGELLDNSHEPKIKNFKQSGLDRLKKIQDSDLSALNKIKKANEVFSNLKQNIPLDKASKALSKIGMGFNVLGLALDIGGDWGNVSKAWANTSGETNIYQKWLDFNEELLILAPDTQEQVTMDLYNFLPYGVNAIFKTAYLSSLHSDIDVGKTLLKHLNPFDFSKGNYVSKPTAGQEVQIAEPGVWAGNPIMAEAELVTFAPTTATEIGTVAPTKGAEATLFNFGTDTASESDLEDVPLATPGGSTGNDVGIVTPTKATETEIAMPGGSTGSDVGIVTPTDKNRIDEDNEIIELIGGAGNDSIINNDRSDVLIRGDNGNDIIESYTSDNSTLNAGAGDDVLVNFLGNNVLMHSNWRRR